MKTKGMSVFEKIVEKVVLAVALVAFLAVFAVQFLSSPTVELPGGLGTVPAQQATDVVAQAARNKVAQLESAREPENLPEAPELASDIIARFDGPVTQIQQLTLVPDWPSRDGVDPVDMPVGPTGEGIFTVPTPTAPTDTTAALYMGTIDPSVPLLYAEAAELLPEQQPMDKASVSVQAKIDAEALRQSMAPAQRPEGELILPQAWRANMEIWDIQLLRRSMGSDGTWSEPTVVPAMPGRPSLRPSLENATPPDIASLVSAERSMRAGIRQPRMYNMIAGDIWTPPVTLRERETIERPAEVERLLRQVRSVRSQIESIQEQLDNLDGGRSMILPRRSGDLFDLNDIDPNRVRWPQFDNAARAQAGGGGSGGTPPRPPREDPREERRRALELRLERLNDQLQQAIGRLLELGYDEEGRPIEEDDEDDADFSESAIVPLSEAQEISIWAHDLQAEPGQTYQYAVRVRLRNPLFGNAASVGESQQELAAQPTIPSEISDWSDPIRIPQMSEYFVVAASDGSAGLAGSNSPSATIEAFRYFYGAWRKQSKRINAGDAVIASIDLGDQEFPQFVLSVDDNGSVSLDEEAVLEAPELEVYREDFLIDVVTLGEEAVAYFFSSPSEILALIPGNQVNSALLARMRESARLAETQEIRPLDLTDSGTGQPGRPQRPQQPDPADPDSPMQPASPMAPGGAAG